MNSRVDRDVFGKKALQKPETLTIIGGYFHGQQYTFKDRGHNQRYSHQACVPAC